MTTKDDFETITVRIPKPLKELMERTARARSVTVTALIRETMQEALRPVGRIYQQPGLSAAFDDFIRNAAQAPVLSLVTEERSGHRYFFHGPIQRNLTNASLVAIERFNEAPWIIPRRDVVAWFEGNVPALLKDLALTLERQGWARRSAA